MEIGELEEQISEQSSDKHEDQEESFLSQDIWGSLPNDNLEKVIARLPLTSLLRVKCVCKEWKALISSKHFTDLYFQSRKQDPWLLIFPHDDASVGLAYDPSTKRWLDISFTFLPFESRVVASAEGMVCLIPKSSHHKEWLACNPISRVWTSIPCPPGFFKLFFLVFGLFVDDEDGSAFNVVMVGSELVAEDSEQFNLATEVYDSKSRDWRKGGSMLLDAPLSPWKATCNGVMYCVTGSLPFRVLGYHVKRGVWSEVKAAMPESLTSVRLFDHGGSLIMVGGIGENGISSRIGMWKLDSSGTGWMEFGWMPQQYCSELLQSLSRRFVCIGHGNFLYLSTKKCNKVLEHDIAARSWRWIPVNRFFMNIHYHMLRGFPFVPRLQSRWHGI